jgi:hypothetical protein
MFVFFCIKFSFFLRVYIIYCFYFRPDSSIVLQFLNEVQVFLVNAIAKLFHFRHLFGHPISGRGHYRWFFNLFVDPFLFMNVVYFLDIFFILHTLQRFIRYFC